WMQSPEGFREPLMTYIMKDTTNKNTRSDHSLSCGGYRSCQDSIAAWLFFLIGLIATVAIRVVTVLMHLKPIYGSIAWYIGIIGFFLFFVYKFKVGHARAKRIEESGLSEKITKNKPLDCDDYALINSILCGIGSKKERVNYFFIFFLSAIALIIAMYMDFVR
ncbi:MAG: hypothetical protein PHH49_05800, partial [Candidatus Omnitrophica bacterium]|nr:hypothetical protein [Candidatus Omnitrophota bacterium]MDD5488457.1 hypothetical protein [Candidatus Omnitrophota bacterium]